VAVVFSFIPTFVALARQKGRNPWLLALDIPLIFIPLLMQMLIYTGITLVFIVELLKDLPGYFTKEGRDVVDKG
jgi:hypothetical protein